MRSKVTRQFLKQRGLALRDHDALGEGREVFKAFYQKNRLNIYRGADGIEFPVYSDGEVIRQRLPAVLGHLVAGPVLNGFFKPGGRTANGWTASTSPAAILPASSQN